MVSQPAQCEQNSQHCSALPSTHQPSSQEPRHPAAQRSWTSTRHDWTPALHPRLEGQHGQLDFPTYNVSQYRTISKLWNVCPTLKPMKSAGITRPGFRNVAAEPFRLQNGLRPNSYLWSLFSFSLWLNRSHGPQGSFGEKNAFQSSVKKICLLKLREEDLPFKAPWRRVAV